MNTPSSRIASKPKLTIGVLTKNEERRIASCLKSAAFADEVIVVDSGSTDATVAIAENTGAQVFSYPDWQGFAVQRNRLLAHATGDYLFFLDADEEITPELQTELEKIVASGAIGVWSVRWRIVAFGKEFKYFQSKSSMQRLFRRDLLVHFDGVVHEQAVLKSPTVSHFMLRHKLRHFSRDSIRGSMEKLTQYAMLGAAKRAAVGKRGGVIRGMASAITIFVRLYIIQLGFLAGGPGFLFCFFVALEFFMRYAALHYDRDSLVGSVGR